jgi:hypothetical protein
MALFLFLISRSSLADLRGYACRDHHGVGLTSGQAVVKFQPLNMNRFESEPPAFYRWDPKTTALGEWARIAQAEERAW